MPTVFRTGPYRFFFYSHEPNEPAHIHVRREKMVTKFWLAPVALGYNFGFADWELNKIQSIVEEYERQFLEAWIGYFGTER